jgi:hypothetical protein
LRAHPRGASSSRYTPRVRSHHDRPPPDRAERLCHHSGYRADNPPEFRRGAQRWNRWHLARPQFGQEHRFGLESRSEGSWQRLHPGPVEWRPPSLGRIRRRVRRHLDGPGVGDRTHRRRPPMAHRRSTDRTLSPASSTSFPGLASRVPKQVCGWEQRMATRRTSLPASLSARNGPAEARCWPMNLTSDPR